MRDNVQPQGGDASDVGFAHQRRNDYPLLGTQASGAPLKSTAALYAFAAGFLGSHSFYLGRRRLGFARLGMSLTGFLFFSVGMGTAIMTASAPSIAFVIIGFSLILANAIWGYIDGIIILVTPEHELGRRR